MAMKSTSRTNAKKIKLVEIHWIDAEGHAGWSQDNPDDDKPIVIKTYGLLVRRTKQWIIHADTYLPDTKEWGGKGKIPAGMVKKVKHLMTVIV